MSEKRVLLKDLRHHSCCSLRDEIAGLGFGCEQLAEAITELLDEPTRDSFVAIVTDETGKKRLEYRG